MPRPRFSEMLVTRRRQLGLSISQASQVLRLKEQVLIAFEEGDFEHIPKSGYAQGMLSSYARYLGLNPRQVTNQFSTDLNEYLASGQVPDAGEGGSVAAGDTYLAPKRLLPTSGGPAGDLGAFATTSQPHSRQQSASAPLVNQRRYVGTLHDTPDRTYGYDAEDQYYAQPTELRPVATRQASASSTRTRSSSSRSRGRRSTGSYGRAQGYVRDDVTTRRAYADDYAYADEASAYAVGASGRRGTRDASGTRRGSSQRRGQARGGVAGFFSDTRNLLFLVLGILAIVLVVVAVLSVRACSSPAPEQTTNTVPVSQSEQTDKQQSATDQVADAIDEAEDEASSASADAGKGTKKADETPKETKVEVTVDAGSVSWVEILCDGESKVATTVTGPWSETYDVHDSITIEVGDTSSVTVLENGKQRQFDAKASGIGTITIKGTPLATADDASKQGATKKDEDADAKDDVTTDDEERQETSRDTGNDEYVYTYDGYDIYYNESGDFYYFFDPETGQRLNAADGSPI